MEKRFYHNMWDGKKASDRIALHASTKNYMSDSAEKPRIAMGADHAGYHAKEVIKKYLLEQGYPVEDMGTWSDESVDYPDYAKKVADKVACGEDELGVLVCGTGIGMSIAANKVEGIRAAVAHDAMTARMAREHNDANVLTLGGRVVSDAMAVEIAKDFLSVQFAGGRHQRRIDKITAMDEARDAAQSKGQPD
jgi:ribose 5-phosphate isomerase B